MKRFIVDSLIVLILVAVGSSFMDQQDSSVYEEIKRFEKDVNEHKAPANNGTYGIVEDVHLNKATVFAKNSGEVIEEIVGVSVELVASIFNALVE